MTITTPWTFPPTPTAEEASAAQYNDEVVSNLRNLDERNTTRGIVAEASSTSTSAAITSSAEVGDLAIYPVVSSSRAYRIHLDTAFSLSATTGSWTVEARLNSATTIGRLAYVSNTPTLHISGACLWLPDMNGTVRLAPYCFEVTGAVGFAFQASATAVRRFYIEDIGARP